MRRFYWHCNVCGSEAEDESSSFPQEFGRDHRCSPPAEVPVALPHVPRLTIVRLAGHRRRVAS